MSSDNQQRTVSADEAAAVLALLKQQRDLYQRLHRLVGTQRRLIQRNDSGALLALLSDRQQLTESLLDLGRQIASRRAAWPQAREALSPGDRTRADELLAEVNAMIGRIAVLDEEDARMLSAHKARAALALNGAKNERAAVNAYSATVSGQRSTGKLDQRT